MFKSLCLSTLLLLSSRALAQEPLSVLWPPWDHGDRDSLQGLALSEGRLALQRHTSDGRYFVRAYRLEGSNWIEDGVLSDPSDGLGGPLAIDGDRVAVGASGKIHLFRRFGDHRWGHREILEPHMGLSSQLVLDGDRMAASTRSAATSRFTVDILRREDEGWVEEQSFDTTQLGSFPGFNMRFDDPYLVIATRLEVSVYQRKQTLWSLKFQVPNDDPGGPFIDLDGKRLVVRSQSRTVPPRLTLTTYERGPRSWTAIGSTPLELWAPFTLRGDHLYFSSGNTLVLTNGQWVENGAFAPPDDALHISSVPPRVAGPLMACPSEDQLTEYNFGAVMTFGLDGRRASLHASTSRLSLTSAGTLALELDAGSENAGAAFVLAGSLAGTSPGFQALGTHIPLTAHDPYFAYGKRVGRLDGEGRATVEVAIPAVLPGSRLGFLKDRTLHHAFVVFRPQLGIVHVSNVTRTALVGSVPH